MVLHTVAKWVGGCCLNNLFRFWTQAKDPLYYDRTSAQQNIRLADHMTADCKTTTVLLQCPLYGLLRGLARHHTCCIELAICRKLISKSIVISLCFKRYPEIVNFTEINKNILSPAMTQIVTSSYLFIVVSFSPTKTCIITSTSTSTSSNPRSSKIHALTYRRAGLLCCKQRTFSRWSWHRTFGQQSHHLLWRWWCEYHCVRRLSFSLLV